MHTKYLTTLSVTFNPFSRTRWHKTPRLLLAYLPPSAVSQGLKVSTTILPQHSLARSSIAVGYKDGRTLVFEGPEGNARAAGGVTSKDGEKAGEVKDSGATAADAKDGVFDLRLMGLEDVLAEVERHTRLLRRKDELTN